MHEIPRRYTALIIFLGVFEWWLCVPLCFRGAVAHFQNVMSTLVRFGLMYINVELYIVDIIIHGQSDNELLVNIRADFGHFSKICLLGTTL